MNISEAFNDIREENTRLRAINAELLAAAEAVSDVWNNPEEFNEFAVGVRIVGLRDAIAAAKGMKP